jgi:hypothetical protein
MENAENSVGPNQARKANHQLIEISVIAKVN